MDKIKSMNPFNKKGDDQKADQNEEKALQEQNDTNKSIYQDPKDKSFFENMRSKADTYQNQVKDKLNQTKNEMAQNISLKLKQIDSAAKNALLNMKNEINSWIRLKVEQKVMSALEKTRPKVKSALKDPDMCDCVKGIIDNVIDETWPRVMEEARFHLQMEIHQPFIEFPPPTTPMICLPCAYIRRAYLYAYHPYDRTIWKSLKNPWYWFFMIVQSFPYYGVQPCFYFFI